MDVFSEGFSVLFHDPLLMMFIMMGMMIGLIFGAIPGLGVAMAAAMILPFTYEMTSTQAITIVSSMYAAGVFGGCTSAILFNIPGTPDSACTAIDGYPLRKQGKAAYALGTAVTSSTVGGVFGALSVIFLSTILADIAMLFGPFEFFSLVLLGLIATASLGAQSSIKGLISSVLGVFLSTVGLSSFTGQSRFTFGSSDLMAGIDFVPVMIGAFAMSEVIMYYYWGDTKQDISKKGTSKAAFVFKELIVAKYTVIRSAILGLIMGILPGAGATMASFLSYGVEDRMSRKTEPLGNGAIKGVIAPETATNAAAMGSLIPLFAIGIPGSAVAAIMLGIFEIHNLQPGPVMFLNHRETIYPVFATILIANILILPFGILAASLLGKLIYFPKHILFAVILALCIVGSFAINNNLFDVLIMVIFGFVGLFFKRYGFSIPALVLGLILGPVLEDSFLRMVIGNVSILERPIGLSFLFIAILFVLLPLLKRFRIRLNKS